MAKKLLSCDFRSMQWPSDQLEGTARPRSTRRPCLPDLAGGIPPGASPSLREAIWGPQCSPLYCGWGKASTLQLWLECSHGTLSFHLTQMLLGHGCFGSYLFRIGRKPTAGCHHCNSGANDTTRHTLLDCSAWEEERRVLGVVVGRDALVSLPAIGSVHVRGSQNWDTVASFCAAVVMTAKEVAEGERQKIAMSLSRRNNRSRRSRRRRHQELRPL